MYSMRRTDLALHCSARNSAWLHMQWVSRLLDRGVLVMKTVTETVCQDCGRVEKFEDMQKVSNEGWLCFMCLGEWRQGNDYY